MKAMVLSAGLGTRLGELTISTPKPLLPVGGSPLLHHTLGYLAGQGVADVVINLHHLPDAIPTAIGDGSAYGLHVRYSFEEELLGTAGAVSHAASLLESEEPVIVLYGDLLIDQDLRPIVDQHRRTSAALTLLAHRRVRSNSVVVLDDDRRVVEFRERPADDDLPNGETWVNSGLYVLDPALPRALGAQRPLDFPRHVFPRLVDDHSLFAHPLSGHRVAIDSPARLREADEAVLDGRYRPQLRHDPPTR